MSAIAAASARCGAKQATSGSTSGERAICQTWALNVPTAGPAPIKRW
jgi:hypothetical protein